MRKKICVLSFSALLLTAGLSAQSTDKDQPLPAIDIKHYKISATLLPEDHELKSDVLVEFVTPEPTNQVVFEINKGLKINSVLDEKNQPLDFIKEEDKSFLAVKLKNLSRAGEKRILHFNYEGVFNKASVYKSASAEGYAYVGEEGSYLLYPAKWLPLSKSFQTRSTCELQVSVPLGITVISTGEQKKVVTKGVTEIFSWSSTKEVLPPPLFASQVFEKIVKKDNFDIGFYLNENNLKQSEKYAEAIQKIVNFYEGKFGPAPFERMLKVVELSDTPRDPAGTLGMIYITGKELQSSKIPIEPLARRLAYQWWLHHLFPRSGQDLWLSDGFAYYAAALYMEDSMGKEAFQNELVDLATLALKFEGQGPISKGADLGYGTDAYESIVGGKGAWVLNMLRGLVGDESFFAVLKKFYQQNGLRKVSIADFEKLVQEVSGKDLGWFFTEWVNSSGVPDLTAEYTAIKTPKGYKIRGHVRQDLDLFRMPVELEIETKGKKESTKIDLQGKSSFFEIETPSVPLRVKLDPSNKILRNSESLRLAVQISKGRKLFENGNYVEAIREFNEAVRINPRSSLAHYSLGETFFAQYSLQSAAPSFRDALNGDLAPKWIEVWSHIYLGKIYDILNQRERARAEYNKAINTKDDTFGAQAEANKYFSAPYSKDKASSLSQ